MRFIIKFLLSLNIMALFIADIYLWTHGAIIGLLGLVSIAGFWIAYACYMATSVSLQDFWTTPVFSIFMKRIIFANVCALFIFSALLVAAANSGNERATEFYNLTTASFSEQRE